MTNLKEILKARPAIGTFLKLPRVEVVDVLARAGADFCICDMEHAQITEEAAYTVISAGRANDLPIVVRVDSLSRGLINRLLESGAAGIQVPRVRSHQDVAELISYARYRPDGTRSVSLSNYAANYGIMAPEEYFTKANTECILVGQIETYEHDRPLSAVLNGLDVAFIGTMDLSVEHGAPGNFSDPTLIDHIDEVREAALQSNIALGIYCPTLEAAESAINQGYRYIAVSGDISLLMQASREVFGKLKAVRNK
jgi:4-hydroxy-2-oxoheptanedioate aldolase